jgi:hypothetical protein
VGVVLPTVVVVVVVSAVRPIRIRQAYRLIENNSEYLVDGLWRPLVGRVN